MTRTYYFPFPVYGARYLADTEKRKAIAAQFDRMTKGKTAAGWPIFLFFGDAIGATATTELLSFRDAGGSVQLGAAVIFNTIYLERSGRKQKNMKDPDVWFVLDHERGHGDQVISHARNVVEIADAIENRLRAKIVQSPREKILNFRSTTRWPPGTKSTPLIMRTRRC